MSSRSELLKRLHEKKAATRGGKHVNVSAITKQVMSGGYDKQIEALRSELELCGGDILAFCKRKGLSAQYASVIIDAIRDSQTGKSVTECVQEAVEKIHK